MDLNCALSLSTLADHHDEQIVIDRSLNGSEKLGIMSL